MANILDTKLIDLMPDSLRKQQEIRWICAAVQPEIDEIAEIITTKILFTKLDKLDDLTLDYLLVECGIANSIETVFIKTRQDKINFIQNYIQLKKLKGTKKGIKYALGVLGLSAEIAEWFEYGGDPYWFRIMVNDSGDLSEERLKLIRAFINAYKNTRSWYLTQIRNTYESDIYAVVSTKVRVKISGQADFTQQPTVKKLIIKPQGVNYGSI